MFNEPDLLCFSHLRWGFVFQRPNHLMVRFARRQRAFFVEEPRSSDALEMPMMEVVEHADGPFICTPCLPACLGDAAAEQVVRALVLDLIEDYEIRAEVLWFYTPMALPLAEGIAAKLVVYDCMDELSAFDGAPPELIARERELFARADLVFTGGHSLYRAKRGKHPAVHPFPSSVDAEHFARARRPHSDPPDQREIPRPRLGFFGVIDERMDLELVARIADERPDWHVVMVGPVVKIAPSTLPQRPNIHWLGSRQYAELPAYLAGWDVALMPFARNASTEFISPTKTLEYLAAGKPVVSTSIADVVHPYGKAGLVRIAERDDFVAAVSDALAEHPDARRAAADAFLAGTSWDATWAEMTALMQEAIAGRDARRSPTKEQRACTTI